MLGKRGVTGTTYTNKMYLVFGSPFHMNSIVKHAWLGTILRWMTF